MVYHFAYHTGTSQSTRCNNKQMFDVMSLKQVGEVIHTEIRKRKKTNRKKRGGGGGAKNSGYSYWYDVMISALIKRRGILIGKVHHSP